MEFPSIKLRLAFAVSIALSAASQASFAAQDENAQWQTETTSDGTTISRRHETGSVVVDGDLYVLGGRRSPPVEVYRSSTDGWENLGAAPTDLHHFQPVAIGADIYVIGAMTCCYPNEPSVAEIHVFNTENNNWTIAGQMPADRLRGGGGTIVYQNKIYVVGGNTQGHSGGAVNWFDEYNPADGTWRTLPNAPTARDHFQAVLVGNELVVTGGRQTALPNPFKNTVAETNIYNFSTGLWRVGASIPTQRAGSPTVGVGNEVIVLGGEAAGHNTAFDTVEAYDVNLNEWRTLQPMMEGRHSGASGILGNRLHMISGSAGIGGAPEITSHESLLLQDVAAVEPETPVDEELPVEEQSTEAVEEQPVEEQPEVVVEAIDVPVEEESEDNTTSQETEDSSVEETSLEQSGPSTGPIEIATDEFDVVMAVAVDTGESVDVQPIEQEAIAGVDSADLSEEVGDIVPSSSSRGGSSFGAASWPVMFLMGGLLAMRRRFYK